MLQLQQKRLLPKLPRKFIFFAKLLLFSTTMHLIFFMLFSLLQSWRSVERIRLTDISDGASIVLVPLLKTITPQEHLKTSVLSVKAHAKPAMRAPKSEKARASKTLNEGVSQKKNLTPPKKMEPPKKIPVPPKKEVAKKAPEKKIAAKKDAIKKDVLAAPKQEMRALPTHIDTAVTTTVQQVGHYDLALITLCNEIKTNIAKTWRRPTNIPVTAECYVTVCVHSDTERTVAIIKSSHAIALDIMVKNFVMHYPFPKALWHTEIELIF